MQLLGEGGMGRVYLAEDPVLGRRVAVKAITVDSKLDHATFEEYLNRFSFEAKASAKLNHPSIVAVYDAGDEHGIPWIALEFVEGATVEVILKQRGRLPVEEAVFIVRHIAGALQHAHENEIIHRDVKPANILLDTKTGIAKLTDFGVAKAPWSGLTREGNAVGSPGYMSPEQIEGTPLDPRTDVFSLGAVLYEMIAGKHPFLRDTMASTVFATVSGTYAPLAEAAEMRIPPALDTIVRKCLNPNRDDRYESAAELVRDLRSVGAPTEEAPIVVGQATRFTRVLITSETVWRRSIWPFIVEILTDVCRMVWWVLKTLATSAPSRWVGRCIRDAWREATRATLQSRVGGVFRGIGAACRAVGAAVMWIVRLWRKHPRLLSWGVGIALALCAAGALLYGPITSSPLKRAIDIGNTAQVLALVDDVATFRTPREQRDLVAAGEFLREHDQAGKATDIATVLASGGAASAQAAILKGRIALEVGSYRDAQDALGQAREQPQGAALIRRARTSILRQLRPALSQERASDILIDIVAETLVAAKDPLVRSWAREQDYSLRWNAVRIMEAGGIKVDMVPIHILDMSYSSSVKTRIRAAERLGQIGDKRAVPALKATAAKGWRDPFVASTAKSVLHEKFGLGD